MKSIFKFIINNEVIVRVLQFLVAYLGWSITAVTIVNSNLNTIGLIVIIIGIFLKDIINGISWLLSIFE